MKLTRITIQIIIYVFVIVYTKIKFFIDATRILYSHLLKPIPIKVLGKLVIPVMNNWAIQALAKTQYLRDGEELYFCISTYVNVPRYIATA